MARVGDQVWLGLIWKDAFGGRGGGILEGAGKVEVEKVGR